MKRVLLACITWAVATAPSGGQPASDIGTQINRFLFREPNAVVYLAARPAPEQRRLTKEDGLSAWPQDGSQQSVEVKSRLVLHLKPGTDLRKIIDGRPLELSRAFAPNIY